MGTRQGCQATEIGFRPTMYVLHLKCLLGNIRKWLVFNFAPNSPEHYGWVNTKIAMCAPSFGIPAFGGLANEIF